MSAPEPRRAAKRVVVQKLECEVSKSTAFAALCRSIRKNRGLLLKDQAEAFGCSIAYISAVETGRKGPVPDAFIGKLVTWLGLSDGTAQALKEAAVISTTMKGAPASAVQAKLLRLLGTGLSQLNAQEIEELRLHAQQLLQRNVKRGTNEWTERQLLGRSDE
jgi:transcriptional regulator with XRE-family HTH domain